MNGEKYLLDKTFDTIDVGFEFATQPRVVTEDDVVDFARLSGDFHPEHLDEEYAKAGVHGERIAHGVLVLGMVTGQVNQTGLFERSTIAVLDMNVRFLKAVKFTDTINTTGRITFKRSTGKPDRGIVKIAVTTLNQRGDTVLEAEWALMAKRTD